MFKLAEYVLLLITNIRDVVIITK